MILLACVGAVSWWGPTDALRAAQSITGSGPSEVASTPGFSAVTPTVLADTRTGIGASVGRVGALDGSGAALELQATGRGGLPASGVLAVGVNVSAVQTTANDFGGYLTVYPCGTRPDTSNLNFTSSADAHTTLVTPVSADGQVCIFVYGTAHLIIETFGYFGTDSGFTPVTPSRIVDSRSGVGTTAGRVDSVRTIQVSGRAGLPATGVHAAHVIVTKVDSSGGTLTVSDCHADSVAMATDAGETTDTYMVLPLNSDGEICVRSTAATHLIIDVHGYETVASGLATPSFPRNLEITAGSFTVSWDPPEVGISNVAAYRVHIDDVGSCTTPDAATTSCMILGTPQAGSTYIIDVRAVSGSGMTGVGASTTLSQPARFVELETPVTLRSASDGSVSNVLELSVLGRGGIPASGVSAVAVTIRLSQVTSYWSTAAMSVYPCTSPSGPGDTTFVTGQERLITVLAPVSSAGKICMYLYPGAARLQVTALGYVESGPGFERASAGGYDSRSESPLSPSASRVIRVVGAPFGPPLGATGVYVSATTFAAGVSGTVALSDCGATDDTIVVPVHPTVDTETFVRIPVSADGDVCAETDVSTHLRLTMRFYETSDIGFRLPPSPSGLTVTRTDADEQAFFEISWEPPTDRTEDVLGYVVTATGTSGCEVTAGSRICMLSVSRPTPIPGASATYSTFIGITAVGVSGVGPAVHHVDTQTISTPALVPQVQDFEFISTGSDYATLVAQVDPGGTYTVVELTCTPTRGGTPRIITNAKGGSGWQTEVLGCDNLLEGREYTAQMRIYNSSGEVVTPVLTFTTDPAIGFTIDEGAAFTRSGTVTLTFVPGDAVDALVSNDGSFADATLADPTEPLTWSLSTPDVSGTRVVYAKLIRANGDRIGTFTDDIVLDRNAPTVSAWTATVGTTARLTIDATDDLSGLGALEVVGPSGSTSLTFGDGNHDIPLGFLTAPGGDRSGRFRVKDTVGNASAWTDFSTAIAPQTTPPTDDDASDDGASDDVASDDSTVAPETVDLPNDDELALLPQIAPTTALGRDTTEPLVPGEQVAVTFPAGTFSPLEWVSLSVHSEPVHVLTAQAGSDGSLSARLTVPGTVGSGSHTLAAVGQTSRRGASVAIQIAAPRSFVALTPSRLLDTRSDDKVGRLDGSGAALTLDVAGQSGLPTTGIGAVALNVTVVDTEANDFGGYVTVYPCGTKPNSSNLNFVSGQTVANSVIAPVSAAGQVCFYVYGKAHLLADVSGYFPTGFTAMTPQRLLDTRPTGRRVGELNGTGRELELQVSGTAGVPTTGVSAVALNVTVVDGQANDFGGYVAVYPCGTRPDSSNLNFVSGQTVPNSVIAPLSSNGSICLYVYGSAHLLADVSGYFTDGFEPLTPARLLDTRQTGTKVGQIDGTGQAHVLQVGGKGVPASAIAVALNVTVADTAANDFGGFVTVYPCGTRPNSSNLNFQSGQTVPNSVIAPLSPDGTLCIYVYGTSHVLIDVSGHL